MNKEEKELLKEYLSKKAYEYVKSEFPDISKEESIKIVGSYCKGFTEALIFIENNLGITA